MCDTTHWHVASLHEATIDQLEYQLQHTDTAKYCHTLSHAATHCNTLQHTATQHEAKIGELEYELEVASDRLCDAESALVRALMAELLQFVV